MSNYSYTKKMDCDFSTAVEKTRKALKEEGFGILTEIDVKAAMKEKLDKDMEDYVILGACNPKLASQALDFEREIGLLLPCNVIVYKQGDDVFVSTILPSVAMSFTGNDLLEGVVSQAEQKLISAIDNT